MKLRKQLEASLCRQDSTISLSDLGKNVVSSARHYHIDLCLINISRKSVHRPEAEFKSASQTQFKVWFPSSICRP